MTEAFYKVMYIIRLIFTNKLSKKFKKIKLKPTKCEYINCNFFIKIILINKVNKNKRNDTIEKAMNK